jgi:hypothetical protein
MKTTVTYELSGDELRDAVAEYVQKRSGIPHVKTGPGQDPQVSVFAGSHKYDIPPGEDLRCRVEWRTVSTPGVGYRDPQDPQRG